MGVGLGTNVHVCGGEAGYQCARAAFSECGGGAGYQCARAAFSGGGAGYQCARAAFSVRVGLCARVTPHAECSTCAPSPTPTLNAHPH